jgi:hypothetical protein
MVSPPNDVEMHLDAGPIRDRRISFNNINVLVTMPLLPKQKVSST